MRLRKRKRGRGGSEVGQSMDARGGRGRAGEGSQRGSRMEDEGIFSFETQTESGGCDRG